MTFSSDAPASAAPSTAGQRLYRAIWRWHFFAGLLVLPFMITLAVTGSLYLFRDEIDASLFRYRNYVAVEGQALKASEIAEKALETAPGATLRAYRTPAAQDRSVRVTLATADGNLRVFVDPYTGAVLDRVAPRDEFNEVVRDLHSLDYFGGLWNGVIEVVAGFAIVLVLTGIYLWWPRGQAGGIVSVRGTPARRVFWRDLHAVTGIFAGALIVFLAVTGLLWSGYWGANVQGWLTAKGIGMPVQLWDDVPKSELVTNDVVSKPGWLMEHAPVPESAAPAGTPSPIGLDRAIEIADAAEIMPGYEVAVPRGETGVYTAAIYPEDLAFERTMHIDQYSGKPLVDISWSQYPPLGRAIEWGINVHMGQEWGLFNQLLMLATCLAIILSSVAAAVMWWKRRPEGRLGVPPAPREKAIYAGLWLIAVVFGIAFPLTGLAIVAMIVLDLTVIRFVPPLRRVFS
ncbi:MAG: PepSY domain-containing protein [Shinella sp.]|nr:PepSY domain-containing protein [Shinella sp.]